DDRWLDIIGARFAVYTYEQTQYCVPIYGDDQDIVIANKPNSPYPSLAVKYGVSPYDDEDVLPEETPNDPCPPGYKLVITTRCYTQVFYKESDGIVLAESDQRFPGARQIQLKPGHSNHEQIKNDENTKNALNSLYNGQRGEYFWTPPR